MPPRRATGGLTPGDQRQATAPRRQAADVASDYVHGQTRAVDGGWLAR
ncbi:hypothetical protein [Sanguibacter massiliensis]|nr:hypothetical protein [Sanguibacter massiliensis]